MDKEKKTEFTVTDRRKFTEEGELRPENTGEESRPVPRPEAAQPATPTTSAKSAEPTPEAPPPPPSTSEQQEQAKRYRDTSQELDSHLQRELDAQGQGRKASDFEITFEKFVASLYMSALFQLGLVQDQGAQPAADLIGARQTIDTISLLAEKTRGNLTANEEHMLSNILYELRMAYVEVTNALTHPPAGVMPPDRSAGLK